MRSGAGSAERELAGSSGAEVAYLPFTRPDLDEETIQSVVEVLRSGWLASGPQVAAFERELSAYLGARTVRAFTSGTAALEVALQVAGVRPGDEVVVPALSFAATANVVVRAGARPVFADVERDTFNLDLERARAAITARTRAILPVHFAGRPVDLDALYGIARDRGIRVIEDAAHAIGSSFGGQRIGAVGDLVAFSFHPNKNMTTIEGGALSLPDAADTSVAELHRFHGISRDADGNVDVLVAGGKHNLSDVAACVGRGQLRRLEGFNERRRALARQYLECLRDLPGLQLPAAADAGHSWHMFNVVLPLARLRSGRRGFIQAMHRRGIGVGIHYPAMHLFSVYRGLGYAPGDFPHAERIGEGIVTLPLFPAMTASDVDRVCEAVRDALEEDRA